MTSATATTLGVDETNIGVARRDSLRCKQAPINGINYKCSNQRVRAEKSAIRPIILRS